MVLAVTLLALLTSASNHAPPDGGGGQALHVGLAATRQAGGGGGSSPTTTVGPTTTVAPAAPETTSTVEPSAEESGTSTQAVDDDSGSEPDGTGSQVAPAPLPAAPAPIPVGLTRLPNVELEVLTLTNMDRGNNGVPPIYRDGCLDAAASDWAHAMADSATMAHSAGGGAAVQGCRGASASWGDNIGYWQPCNASEMEAWWMASPSHRPHILDGTYTAVGIGVWAEPSGRCWFEVYFGS